MRFTAKIVLFTTILALSMLSTSMAEYKLKPADEIGKNLFGLGVKKAQENPEMVEKAAEKMIGEDDTEPPNSNEDEKDKEGMKSDK